MFGSLKTGHSKSVSSQFRLILNIEEHIFRTRYVSQAKQLLTAVYVLTQLVPIVHDRLSQNNENATLKLAKQTSHPMSPNF